MKTRGKRKGSNLTPRAPAIPSGRGKRIGPNLTPPEPSSKPPTPAGRGRLKATIFVRSEAERENRRASSLRLTQSSGSESDSSDHGEAIDDPIAHLDEWDEWMEDGADILQADLEIISRQFGYEGVGKEKDLILKLLEKCETQQSPEALEVVVEYMITKLRLLKSGLRILLGVMHWNIKVVKCVYHATQKFKEEFFAEVEDVETLIQAADRLIKLGSDDGEGDWLITAGCSYIKIMVADLNRKRILAILAVCLVKYPTSKKATLEALKTMMPWLA